MKVIRVRNVHQALPEALRALLAEGVERDSRNGPVLAFDEPVTTVYERPAERVVFWPQRDANPFFHLMESVWMLAGRNDVETVARYVGRMRTFSDDGLTLHGAYGHRWRKHFGFDQLVGIIEALRKDPTDRRQVLSMWDAGSDLGRQGRDVPCNLQAVFQITSRGALDMTVTNRSNDLIWGAYGANAVHFSYVHEFIARAVGVPQGVYRQVSMNLHAYLNTLETVQSLAAQAMDPWAPPGLRDLGDPYSTGAVVPFPVLGITHPQWLFEAERLLQTGSTFLIFDPFLNEVAGSVMRAHSAYRAGKGCAKFDTPLRILEGCPATDWQLACMEWIERRRTATKHAQDDGVRHE